MRLVKISFLLLITCVLGGSVQAQMRTHEFRNTTLRSSERVRLLMQELSMDEKIDLLCAVQPAIERLGIPAYDWWSECLHGVARAGKATVFPKPIATGSSWDRDLVERIATAISDEARAKYHHALRTQGYTKRYEGLTFFSPTLNMARDPRWGRTVECYSEDPYLMGTLGTAFVEGLQGDDPHHLKLLATAKHFAANNEENRRNDGSATVDERSLREYYLPAFRRSVQEAGTGSVMSAYNALNGVPCTANPHLLTQILRREWGFQGVVISDGSAMAKIHTHHHYKTSPEEGAAAALLAGCDMALRDEYRSTLPVALKKGLIEPSDIDTAVRRVLTQRFRLGMFDPDTEVTYSQIPYSVVESQTHRDLALEAARKSIILLKNQGILPIDTSRIKHIALVGEAFREVYYGDYSAEPTYNLTLREALQSALGTEVQLTWVSDVDRPAVVTPEYYHRPQEHAYEGLMGLTGEYYNNNNLEGEPFTIRHDQLIDFHVDQRQNAEMQAHKDLSVRWKSALSAPFSGEYLFTLEQQQAKTNVWIDGVQVVDEQNPNSFRLHMEKGKQYDLRMESREVGRTGEIQLLWQELFANQTQNPEQVAATADMALVFIRDAAGAEGRDRNTLSVNKNQLDLVRRITTAQPHTAVILGSSTPLILTDLAERSPALLNIWIAGQGEAQATAEILLGTINPSGKTAVTFFANENQIPPLDNYDIAQGRSYQYFTGNTLYPFGFGLSYTTYVYDQLRISTPTITSPPESLTFTVEVRNSGARAGEEIVQCYIASPEWIREGLRKRLVAFERVALQAGESQTLTITIPASELTRWNTANQTWQLIPGQYTLTVGPNSETGVTQPFAVK